MKSALDTRVGVDIRGTSKIFPWMLSMPWCSSTDTSWAKMGKTAYERLRGKKSKMLGF